MTRFQPNSIYFLGFIYLFLERGEGKEKEREKKINVWLPLMRPLLGIWSTTQACALIGNQTGDPLVHRPMLNPLSYTSQGQIPIFVMHIMAFTLLNNVPSFKICVYTHMFVCVCMYIYIWCHITISLCFSFLGRI